MQVVVVSLHVEVAVSGEVEQDDLLPTRLPRLHRLVDHGADGVGRFGTCHDALAPGELDRGLEHGILRVGLRLHMAVLHQH